MTQVQRFLSLPWSWDIRFSGDDDCWIATIAELPDFFAAGDNAGEAAFNAREALESHLRGYLETGKEIPFPKSAAMTAENAAATQLAGAAT